MKYLLILIVTFSMLACQTNKQNESLDFNTEQIVSQLKWNLSYSKIHKILTEEFKLEYSEEIQQSRNNQAVYKYVGGKYYNIEPINWIVAFKNDSLQSITLLIEKEEFEEIDKINNLLVEINNKELSKDQSDLPYENRWYLEKDGKKYADLLISKGSFHSTMTILYSKTK